MGDRIQGSNANSDNINTKKEYDGTYDIDTNQVRINVTYSTGDIGVYSGVLASEGQISILNFEMIKGVSLCSTGDFGFNKGITSYTFKKVFTIRYLFQNQITRLVYIKIINSLSFFFFF